MSLRDALQDIYDERGYLTPTLVVDAARDPNHELHHRLEWDDSIAGEAYRRHQAHELIQSVKVVYRETPDGTERSVRAFHAIRSEIGTTYRPVEEIVNDPTMTAILRMDMEREWRALKARYEQFDEFWHIVRGDLGNEEAA
jgi:hypothetical protein